MAAQERRAGLPLRSCAACRVQLRPQGVDEALVARPAKQVVEAPLPAPVHDRLAAEARAAPPLPARNPRSPGPPGYVDPREELFPAWHGRDGRAHARRQHGDGDTHPGAGGQSPAVRLPPCADALAGAARATTRRRFGAGGVRLRQGSYARFVKVRGQWHMSMAPQMAAIASRSSAPGGPATTATRSRCCPTATGACGSTPGRRAARVGDTVEVVVTAKSGRVDHVKARVTDIVENEHGDRQVIGEIVERDSGRSREPYFDASHGITEPCPVCGTTACDSGVTGRCTISPEQHPREFGDIPLADTPREDFDTHVEPIALAQSTQRLAKSRISTRKRKACPCAPGKTLGRAGGSGRGRCAPIRAGRACSC